MIRRTIWLSAGAVLGIAGYRRLDRVAKTLTASQAAAKTAAALPAVRQAAGIPARAGGAARSGRPGGSGRTATLAGLAIRSVIWLVRRAGASAGFLAEVRAGMDEYLDSSQQRPGQPNINRHYARPRNTLVGQRPALRAADSTAIGAADSTAPGAADHDTIKDGR
ncbi:MAG TPA: hypothetical protein VFQ44_15840 [Streptosporangiaceae bacterium]|nr:hypothetical protein [Streptosporangiaceae bacterium]